MSVTVKDLPGLDCGVCGFRTCSAFADRLVSEPDLIKRCIQLFERPFSRAAESGGGSGDG